MDFLTGFFNTIQNYLGVPQGVLIRKNYPYNGNNTVDGYDITENDYISVILDITVDDICIGNSPLSYTCADETPESVRVKTDQLCEEFNKIMKWTARDLCVKGYSIYTASVVKEKNEQLTEGTSADILKLMPFLDAVEFFMDKNGEIVVYNAETKEKENLDNIVLFINYDKTSLSKIKDSKFVSDVADKKLLFSVKPTPMQLKKVASAVKSLGMCESALLRYREQMSRIARFMTVDVGVSQGDQTDNVVDGISSAINADSLSLMTSEETCLFNDAIPVIPHRRGYGKPELQSDIPQYDLKELGDIDYFLSKVSLMTRFPATYIDFSKTIDSGVATLIKGDIRYSKLCESVRTCINDTINKYFRTADNFKDYDILFALNTSPDSADADRVTALSDITDITDRMHTFIIQDGEGDVDIMRKRLELLKVMVGSKCSSVEVSNFFDKEQEYLDLLEQISEQSEFESVAGLDEERGGMDLPRPSAPQRDFDRESPIATTESTETEEAEPTTKSVGGGDTVELFPLGANE